MASHAGGEGVTVDIKGERVLQSIFEARGRWCSSLPSILIVNSKFFWRKGGNPRPLL